MRALLFPPKPIPGFQDQRAYFGIASPSAARMVVARGRISHNNVFELAFTNLARVGVPMFVHVPGNAGAICKSAKS